MLWLKSVHQNCVLGRCVHVVFLYIATDVKKFMSCAFNDLWIITIISLPLLVKSSAKMLKSSEIPALPCTLLLQKTLPKSCELDPMPTSLIKMHSDAIADKITQIINTSLAEGTVGDNLKEAILCLLLKKSNLDVMTFKNCCPVSNLAYISELLEWVVCGQLTHHVEGTGNVEPMPLAYRPNYSTEMALLCVKTDLLDAIHKKEVTCLVLLDLSATFDTANHSILLHHLKYRFGILDLITSYLTN